MPMTGETRILGRKLFVGKHTQGDNAVGDIVLFCDVELNRIALCYGVSKEMEVQAEKDSRSCEGTRWSVQEVGRAIWESDGRMAKGDLGTRNRMQIICWAAQHRKFSTTRIRNPEFASQPPFTRCAILLRHICWGRAWTSDIFRNC
jgi:hypothetical protein